MAFGSPPRSRIALGRARGRPATWRLGIDWRDFDWLLLGAALAIAALGLVMIYSTTRNLVERPVLLREAPGALAMIVGVVRVPA